MKKNYSFSTGNEVMVNFARWCGLVQDLTFLSTWEASLMLPTRREARRSPGKVLGKFRGVLLVAS